jgi:hypothetical protein
MEKLTQKAQVLDKMRSERKRLEDVVFSVSPDRMTLPSVQGEWSVKDILAHITSWESLSVDCIKQVKNGGTPIVLVGMTQDAIDSLNRNTYLENKLKPLTRVCKEFKKSFLIHVKAVEAYSEEGLMSPAFRWQWGEGLWTVVAANSFWHYEEHYSAINEWITKFGKNIL